MASDQESLRASGGASTAPQTVKPMPMGKNQRKVDSAGKAAGGGGKKKALLIGLGIVVFLAAAAAVANYFVLPIFLSDTEIVAPPPVDETPEDLGVTPTIPTFVHTSYFEDAVAGGNLEVNVNTVNADELRAALQTPAANRASAAPGTITEFYVTQGLTGAPIEGQEIIEALLPDVQFLVNFHEDFTGFIYTDAEGAHPGYIFAVDTDSAALAQTKASFNDAFESSNSLGNLFLVDPGTKAEAGFKDGAAIAGGGTSRWITFSGEGMSLDYGWKGPFVIISTSFDGFKAAAARLGTTIPATEAEATTETEGTTDTATTTQEAGETGT